MLPDGENHLIDSYEFQYLTVGRDVLRIADKNTGNTTEPIVAAAPDYDITDQSMSDSMESTKTEFSPFRALPGTESEGKEIAKLLQVRPMLGPEVLETELKAHRAPQILHIATHGFFIPYRPEDPFGLDSLSVRPDNIVVPATPPSRNLTEFERLNRLSNVQDPLLRSGLALAGANQWIRGNDPPESAEDGLLTAEDVMGWDLLGTELVVLSACDTGLGDIRGGEGVYGLRRAFVVAGARALIMSLWKVPDAQTQELMVEFYKRLLRGAPRGDALRGAQRVIKECYLDPYYWGAFVCQGDPGPL